MKQTEILFRTIVRYIIYQIRNIIKIKGMMINEAKCIYGR